jgi:hypothetical protein
MGTKMVDIEKEISKLKFHISLIGETIDRRANPIPALIIEMDWDEENLDSAHDIFEKYDAMLDNDEEINWRTFEMELRDKFHIGYQTVKTIILAFYRNHQWTQVCQLYAQSAECVEFHEITRPKE